MIEELAQKQLECYNAHDLEGFLACYSEDVEVYHLKTNELLFKGKKAMRDRYAKRFESKVHARLENRMILKDQAIDYEYVTSVDSEPKRAIAIYLEEEQVIRKVWFIYE